MDGCARIRFVRLSAAVRRQILRVHSRRDVGTIDRNHMRFANPLVVLCLAAGPLHAQDTLTVLRHAPSDTASPGNVITVTFDRPVAGRLDATIEAARIFRIEPAIKGTVEWRDPITIRFIPDEPITPGTDVLVVIDTAFRAIDGSRLVRPYRF